MVFNHFHAIIGLNETINQIRRGRTRRTVT